MNNRSTIIAYTLSGLLLITSTVLLVKENRDKKEIIKEKQAGEMLSESNEKLKKELALVRNDFTKNANQLNEIIKSNERLLAENNARIQKLINENKSGNNAKKLLKEIESQNKSIQSDLEAARSQYAVLLKQSEKQGSQIADLETINAQLREQVDMMKRTISDNVSIAATRGKKSKLTVTAARTNLISATLDIPGLIL